MVVFEARLEYLDKHRKIIPEFCVEVTGCGICGLVAKCDESGTKLFAFEKEGK